MTSSNHATFLRRALTADAVLTGIAALALLAGASALEDLLGLPAVLLRGAGLSLVPFTAVLIYLLRREAVPRGAAWFIIACNALWAIDSILLLFTPWVDPTLPGQVFVVLQAIVVAAFAEVQAMALRRTTAQAA